MYQKKRILLVHNHYKISGGEDTVFENEKSLLESQGYSVFLYTRSNREIDEFSAFQKLLFPLTALFSLHTYQKVKKIILDGHIDIVHVHNTLSLISPAVYYAALRCKVPVVQTLHNYRLICSNGILYRAEGICEECVRSGSYCAVKHCCYRDSRVQTIVNLLIIKVHKFLGIYNKLNFICLTNFQREKIVGYFPKARFFVKPNFTSLVNKTVIHMQDAEHRYYIYVGRMEKNKGIWKILEAFEKLTDLNLLMVGTGVEEDAVKSYLYRKKMQHVQYCGFQNKEWITSHLAGAKALIQPSQCYETFGMTVIESFACGTPVIASNVGVFSEFIKGKGTGLLFKHNSSEDLREKILYMEKNPDFQIQAGSKAYQMWKELYSLEVNLQKIKEIYSEVQEE